MTGASGSIGSAVAKRLAKDGASVIVHYNASREEAERVVRDIVSDGGEAAVLGADLSDRNGPQMAIDLLDAAFGSRYVGRLDVLVNNAGSLGFSSLMETTDDEFDRIFNLNVRAVFQLSREAARRMTAGGWGRIINIGSVFGEATTVAGLGLYSGTKFAVRGLTRAWSRDVGPFGVTVNSVQPAVIQSDPMPTDGPTFDAMERYTSVGRFGKPEEIAHAVAFLASPASGFINGESLNVDGGWSA